MKNIKTGKCINTIMLEAGYTWELCIVLKFGGISVKSLRYFYPNEKSGRSELGMTIENFIEHGMEKKVHVFTKHNKTDNIQLVGEFVDDEKNIFDSIFIYYSPIK